MRPSHRFLVVSAAAMLWAGCSDEPSGPGPGMPNPDPVDEEVILSNALSTDGAASVRGEGIHGLASVAYVSLPPGTIIGADFVILRNLTTGAVALVDVVNGGFDPVAIEAEAGNRLELEIRAGGAILGRKYSTVPASRPPVIVRTSPPPGRTDVALAVRPVVIFSEPMASAGLDASLNLFLNGAKVEEVAELIPTAPWIAEMVPTTALEPETTYAMEIGIELRDLDGEALQQGVEVKFTTAAAEHDPGPEPEPPPVPTPVTEEIVFSRGGDIWVMNADGSGQRQITTGPALDEEPSWSPDGQQIAFTRYRPEIGFGPWGSKAIYRINADGAGLVRLSAPSDSTYDYQPDWSPDGTRIAFVTRRDTEVVDWTLPITIEVYTMGPQGEDPVRVTHYGAWVTNPAWSTDGSRFAYARFGGEGWELYVSNADGSGAQAIAPTSLSYAPAWSPDGHSILTRTFPHCIDPGPDSPDCVAWEGAHLTLIAADGSNPTRVSDHELYLDPEWAPPTWSPEGSRIALTQNGCIPYATACTGTQSWIEVVRISDGEVTILGEGSHPDWRR